MSYELINRITVKNDGVYVSSHSNNDTDTFHSHRIDSLSKVYFEEGQFGLDREIIRMLSEYAADVRGNHKSVIRYKKVLGSDKVKNVCHKYAKILDEEYEKLSLNDIDTIFYKPTPAAKKYLEFETKLLDQKYSEIAALLPEVK